MAIFGNFESFKGLEFIDPSITIDPVVKEADPVNLTITVDIMMSVPGATVKVIKLTNVAVHNLNYDAQTLNDRVMEHLNNYHLISE